MLDTQSILPRIGIVTFSNRIYAIIHRADVILFASGQTPGLITQHIHPVSNTRMAFMKRPLSVILVGALVLIQGLVFTAIWGLILSAFGTRYWGALPPKVVAELPDITLPELLLAVTNLVMGLVGLISGVGILRLRAWAGLMALIAQGMNLVAELVSYTRGEANYLNMLISVIIVFYLNQRDVRNAFSVAQHREDPESARSVEEEQAAIRQARRDMAEDG